MLHPATKIAAVDPAIGLGVVATAPIPRGSITWVRDPLDQVLTPAAVAALPAPCTGGLWHYCGQTPEGDYLLYWDLARYVNHSCAPNCIATEWGFEIAAREIAVGEELTNDYANLGMRPTERIECRCGTRDCRGVVSQTDATTRLAQWERAIAEGLARVNRVRQPLWSLLPRALQDLLRARYPR